MEGRIQKIPLKLQDLLVPSWSKDGQFINIYLKCQLKVLPEGYQYCVKMKSKDHTQGLPDPVGKSFYDTPSTEWATSASHAFITPLKVFQCYDDEQSLQFTVFICPINNNNAVSVYSSILEHCSAEALISKIIVFKPTPIVLKSQDNQELGEISSSIIKLDGPDDNNYITMDITLNLSSKDAKYIKSLTLKIYGEGNTRDEVMEIYSQKCTPNRRDNSEEMTVSFQPKKILLSSIFGKKDKQFCWFKIIFEGKNDQSREVSMEWLFPVDKETVLKSQKKIEPIKVPLDQNQKGCFTFRSATYLLSSIQIEEKIDLKKFLHAGINFNLIAGIDFTKSNGKNKGRGYSLHTITELDKNPYVKGLKVVADILIKFDNDLLVPMYGFGGRPKLPHYTLKKTSHCFPLIGSEQYPEMHDLKGMMAAYFNIIDDHVILEAPTYFQPIIQLARKAATLGKQESDKNYYILLIITDGIINDGEDTVKEIKLCVDLPISIVIVGVGDENFEDMDYLNNIDGDDRDLVSFVDMKTYDELNEQSFQTSVLEELPGQVTQYYEKMEIKPHEMVDHFEAPSDEQHPGNEAWRRINSYKEEILLKYGSMIEPFLSPN